jgi:Mn-dependent DtxR family transcriptional regulator
MFYKLLENNGSIALEQLAHRLNSSVEYMLETVSQLEFLGLVQLNGNIVTFTAEYAEIAMGLQPYLFPPTIPRHEVS